MCKRYILLCDVLLNLFEFYQHLLSVLFFAVVLDLLSYKQQIVIGTEAEINMIRKLKEYTFLKPSLPSLKRLMFTNRHKISRMFHANK